MLFIETIKIFNRQLHHIEWHNLRLNRTRREFWQKNEVWDLAKMIQLPDYLDNSLYKCRLTYGEKIEKIEFEPYQLRPIRSLKLLTANDLDYSYKFANRAYLNELFAQRGASDDVLIVKNNLITDTTYCNVAFWNGKKWLTPSRPLLNGVKRQILLQKELIYEQKIQLTDLQSFSKAKLFNAMLDFELGWEVDIKDIQE
jgi:4-amino-4-deoxychorismate lyase